MASVRRTTVGAGADELRILKALRTRLAADLDACTSERDVAALAGKILDVQKRISDVEAKAPAATSALDEITARRQNRRRPIRNGVQREQA